MVTILDVARAAGVSKSTVSRVLDERLPRSGSATAERVRTVAAELGYVRDPLASGLRRSGTSTVGVIVPRLTDTVMAMLYEELTAVASERGLFTVVATTEDSPEAEAVAVRTLRMRRVDGLVLTTARMGTPFAGGAPSSHVLALRTDGTGPAAVGDDVLGARLATRHLIDLGHRRIGLVGGPAYASSALGRAEGYRAALTEAGITPDPSLVVGEAFSIEAGEVAGRALLDRADGADRPTAVFAVNDNTAIGVLSAATVLGLAVPGDVSIVGYNDIPVVSRLPTALTTVRVPFRQIAGDALHLLLDDGATPRTLVTTPALIPRRSTAPPP